MNNYFIIIYYIDYLDLNILYFILYFNINKIIILI